MFSEGWDMPRPNTMPQGEALQHAMVESWPVGAMFAVSLDRPASDCGGSCGSGLVLIGMLRAVMVDFVATAREAQEQSESMRLDAACSLENASAQAAIQL